MRVGFCLYPVAATQCDTLAGLPRLKMITSLVISRDWTCNLLEAPGPTGLPRGQDCYTTTALYRLYSPQIKIIECCIPIVHFVINTRTRIIDTGRVVQITTLYFWLRLGHCTSSWPKEFKTNKGEKHQKVPKPVMLHCIWCFLVVSSAVLALLQSV